MAEKEEVNFGFYHKCKECGYNLFAVWEDSGNNRYGVIQCPECKVIEQIKIDLIEWKK